MPEGLIVLDARKLPVRIVLLGVMFAAAAFAFFAIRWQLGDMLAELTPTTDPNISIIADAARSLAPADPRTNWLAATAETSVFTPEAIDTSVGMFEQTVRLSPFDFRWWIEYGRALERAGHPDQAEEGGRVYAIKTTPSESLLEFGHDAVDFRRLHVGDKIWKTSDPELDRRLRQTFAGEQPRFQRPLRLEVHGCGGQPMTMVARDRKSVV